jgi:hypothetical protein
MTLQSSCGPPTKPLHSPPTMKVHDIPQQKRDARRHNAAMRNAARRDGVGLFLTDYVEARWHRRTHLHPTTRSDLLQSFKDLWNEQDRGH